MVVFIIIQVAFIAVDIWMLYKLTYRTDPWYIILFYGMYVNSTTHTLNLNQPLSVGATSIFMAVVTLAYAIKCEINFGKGLKPYGK